MRIKWALSAAIVNLCFLGLFATESSAANSCTKVYVESQTQSLETLGDAEVTDLSKCGSLAVPALIEALQQENSTAASKAAVTLRLIGSEARPAVPVLQGILQDLNQDKSLRRAAADALGAIQPEDSKTIAILVSAIENDSDPNVRSAAVVALADNSKSEEGIIQFLIDVVADSTDDELVRANAAYEIGDLAFANPEKIRLLSENNFIRIIQDSQQSNKVVTACAYAIGETKATNEQIVNALLQALDRNDQLINQQVATVLAGISDGLYQQASTLHQVNAQQRIVSRIYESIGKLDAAQGLEIQSAQKDVSETLKSLELKRKALLGQLMQNWLYGNRAVWILHPIVWLGLIWAYPKSRQIQAFFFWNKHIRAVLGCWYVGPVITAVPFLRCRLFAPFKDSLLADAKLDIFDSQAYFPNSEVQLKGTHPAQPLAKALPEIKGEIILEGESGLGKTILLRHLVRQTKRVTVYLPAYKCEKGVIEAIQAKLHGQAQDAEFLRHLIYSGALDICIDGLNEVGADVRANITAFVESYFKGNILITTQPLLWNPPSTAKTYVLQPLPRNQINRFLSLQQQSLSTSQAQSPECEATCATFLETALDEQQPAEDLALAQRILSNPMDLSVAAQIIHAGLHPDLFQLQQQQYTLMAKDYEQSWNQKFPLNAFSDYVYEMRVNDQQGMTGDAFYQALSIMEQEQHRMVLSRQWQDLSGAAHKEWSFRHDKIMEFFLVQPFLAPDAKGLERRKQHLGDSRFRGIYLMLARLLPLDAALALRENLIQQAADTKDHTVSDDYVQIMRSR